MALGFKQEECNHVVYFAHGGTGTGLSEDSPLPIVSSDLFAIPVGYVVEKAIVVVKTAVTGSSALNIGDDDDNDGFVATPTLTANAVSVGAGAYLASGANKFYPAAGKEVKIAVTGASTAGAFCVIIKGIKI